MIKSYRIALQFIVFILITLNTSVYASVQKIDIDNRKKTHILNKSMLYTSAKDLSMEEVLSTHKFQPFSEDHLNLGISKDFIYLTFSLHNSSTDPVTKVLVLSSPLLESITLYTEEDLSHGIQKGMAHIEKTHATIPYYFTLTLEPKQTKVYYLKIHSTYNATDFTMTLEDKTEYLWQDKISQAINILLIGVVISLMFYSFFLSFYIRDKSYFFYGTYLSTLIYQQMTFLGLTQIYLPASFIYFDMHFDIVKIGLLIMTAALYAMHFLETKHYPKLHKIYKLVIVILILEMLFLPSDHSLSLYALVFTGSFFIFFNVSAGIYIYKKGLKQARLFIVGFSIVSLFYIMIILDTLGFTSLMYYFHNALIWGTALEAFILSLAFADRYMILQQAKHSADKQLLEQARYREQIIQKTVAIKTQKLNDSLKEKELLLREIQHRVKNNLQIILSMIRMQNDTSLDQNTHEALERLENRINAIAKTYSMLLTSEDIQKLDMNVYIDELLHDMMASLNQEESSEIIIETHVKAVLSLKSSVYIGLIINEVVTNAYKHAFPSGKGKITINLKHGIKEFLLEIYDNGIGYHPSATKNSFGLKLINVLVKHQLKGEVSTITQPHCKYIIRFSE